MVAKPALPGVTGGADERRECVRLALLTKALARKLQQWWKRLKSERTLTRDVISDFCGICLRADNTAEQEAGFDAFAGRLRDKEVLEKTRAAMLRVFALAVGRQGRLWRISQLNLNTRVFCAAYMVKLFPNNVFENKHRLLEQALMRESAAVLTSFEGLVDSLEANGGHMALVCEAKARVFPSALKTYLEAFKAWKIPDEQRLGSRIKHALQALYAVNPAGQGRDAAAAERLKVQVEYGVFRLRLKLRKVVGEEALLEFDKRTGRGGLAIPTDEDVAGVEAEYRSRVESSCAPPGTGMIGLQLSNEQLAMELLLNPQFQYVSPLEGSMCGENSDVTQELQAAFWRSVYYETQREPRSYVNLVRIMGEILTGVCELSSSMSQPAKGVLQAALGVMKEQVPEEVLLNAGLESGLYGWRDLFGFTDQLRRTVLSMGVPQTAREAKWEKEVIAGCGEQSDFSTVDDKTGYLLLCKGLQVVLDMVNYVRVHAANERLQKISPVIRQFGAEYLQSHLQKALTAKTLTLQRTTVHFAVVVEAKARVLHRIGAPLVQLLQGNGDAYERLQLVAFVALLTGQEAVTPNTVPETYRLDVKRLVQGWAIAGALCKGVCMMQLLRSEHTLDLVEAQRNTCWRFVRRFFVAKGAVSVQAATASSDALGWKVLREAAVGGGLLSVAVVDGPMRELWGMALDQENAVVKVMAPRVEHLLVRYFQALALGGTPVLSDFYASTELPDEVEEMVLEFMAAHLDFWTLAVRMVLVNKQAYGEFYRSTVIPAALVAEPCLK